jgi:hypothetical protein
MLTLVKGYRLLHLAKVVIQSYMTATAFATQRAVKDNIYPT